MELADRPAPSIFSAHRIGKPTRPVLVRRPVDNPALVHEVATARRRSYTELDPGLLHVFLPESPGRAEDRPVVFILVEHPRLDPRKRIGLEAGTEAFRVHYQFFAWDNEVPHRLARLVQYDEDVDMVGFNAAVRDWDEIPRAKRLDLDCERVACAGVVGEQIDGLGIAKGHRGLDAAS